MRGHTARRIAVNFAKLPELVCRWEGQALPDENKDDLLKLANFRAERRHERRQLEWRFTASLWAALAAAIYKGLCFPPWPFVAIVLIYIWWVGLNWVRNERDIRKAFFYVDRFHMLMLGEMPPTEPRISQKLGAVWLRLAAWWSRSAVPETPVTPEWPQVRGWEMLGCLLDLMFWVEIVITALLAWAAYLVGQQHCATPVT